ncbi:hypothetical protein IAU60_000592 [Kwoniella sp. DSM 27419]
MQPQRIPTTPKNGERESLRVDESMRSSSTTQASFPFGRPSEHAAGERPASGPGTIRFATTTNAFGLNTPSGSSSSTLSPSAPVREVVQPVVPFAATGVDISPPSAGTVTTRRLRRPSMLSLTQNVSFSSDNSGKADDEGTPMSEAVPTASQGIGLVQDPSSSKSVVQPNHGRPFQPQQPPPQVVQSVFNPSTVQPTPRWPGHGGSFANSLLRRTSSAPIIPFEDLKTTTPPIGQHRPLEGEGIQGSDSPMDMEGVENDSRSPLKWAPSHLQSSTASRRKGKARMDDMDLQAPYAAIANHAINGRPLPSALLQTLASEQAPLDHEMQSEAKLQRFLLSHPQKLPLTPRAPRGSRGRFPDQVGGDDDDEEEFALNLGTRRTSSWTRRNWMDRARMDDSDSDSDEMLEDIGGPIEPVNSAFAAGMDMDRPGSSSSSANMWISMANSDSGKSTPGKGDNGQDNGNSSGSASGSNNGTHVNSNTVNPFPTPPSSGAAWPNVPGSNVGSTRLSFSSAGMGMVPSPGNFGGLPSAFGTLQMGGIGTPSGSPTVERSELGVSPTAISSPGLMQYRESQGGQATVRPGKRKVASQAEDRFDPYKRPRGSSPSLLGTSPFPISPSRPTAIPIPQSPSHAPLYPSALSTSLGRGHHTRTTHPYTRPMASRSRAASPALSIGSAGGMGTSVGNGGTLGRSFSLSGFASNASGGGQGQQNLGGLGLLSLQNRVSEEDEGIADAREGETGSADMRRGSSGESRMDED